MGVRGRSRHGRGARAGDDQGGARGLEATAVAAVAVGPIVGVAAGAREMAGSVNPEATIAADHHDDDRAGKRAEEAGPAALVGFDDHVLAVAAPTAGTATERAGRDGLVGDTGLEPVTSCMSSKCSNQLS